MKAISRYSENYFQLSSFKHISALWGCSDLAPWSALMENFLFHKKKNLTEKIILFDKVQLRGGSTIDWLAECV